MKGIVFTMDAIFSLVITLAAISVLLFFQYYSQTPNSIHYSDAQVIMTNLASTSVESVQNSSMIAKIIGNQYLGVNETWPMFLGGVQENDSNPVGPIKPVLVYTFNAGNTITTSIVANYGNIYFAANTILYAVNATTNRVVWVTNTISNVVNNPALNSGMLFFSNATNLTDVNAASGNIIWTTNSIKSFTIQTPIIVYDNQVIFGSSDNKVHAYYENNGTSYWATPVTSPNSIMELGGNLEVETSTGVIDTIVQSAGTANVLASFQLPDSPPITPMAGDGGIAYLGTGASGVNAIYTNGTSAKGFPILTGSNPTGVAAYKNYIIYQLSTGAVTAISPTGALYWYVIVPEYFYGGGISTATPLVTGSMVYTAWGNGIAAQNLTNGAMQWFVWLPKGTVSPYMALAYGRLYVVANNRIMVYGSCYSPLHATLLSAAATMYVNSQPGCGSALLNSIYPAANYTFFVNNPSTNTIQSASFGGVNGYVIAHNSNALNTSYVSVSFWVNISVAPASGARLINYGENGGYGGCATSAAECGWFVFLNPSDKIQFSVMGSSSETDVIGPTLNLNKWYQITGIDNGSYVSVYVSSNTPTSVARIGPVLFASPNINLTIGHGLQSDTRYFTGNIANVQIYSQPLGQQQIAQLYREGVAGVPVGGYGLAAWYPLAGDTNDYSNFNTGYIIGSVKFVTATYTSPAFSNAYDISRASTILPVFNYTSGTSNTINIGIYSWS